MAKSCERGWRKRLAAALLAAAAGLGLVGCYDENCDETATCPSIGGEPSCPADPADAPHGEVPARCGVWVSASLGNDKNDGSPDAPVATLQRALTLALSGPRRVFACNELFDAAIEWPTGVDLHGGFHCEDLHWRYLHDDTRTTLTAPPDTTPLTLKGPADAAPSVLTDLAVTAPDASTPGGSSIAMLALAGARADLRRSEILAGNGADGADGDDHLGAPAKDGQLGKDGVSACTDGVGHGGDMVALDCQDDASFGGEGGDGGVQAANPGDDGEVAPAGSPQGFGLGGTGEDLFAGLPCTPGQDGARGDDGQLGLGAAWPPRLTSAGYLGVWGSDGQRGRAGQGGGGGGASAGNALCGSAPHGGAGGGSGGSGGCGGKGGRGGQPGGASIALALLTDGILFTQVSFQAGNGGRGGAAGMPQQGGQGGLPGIGGAGLLAAGGPNSACVGGSGGTGGDGGHAGGGLGGPSIAVAYTGTTFPSLGKSPKVTYGSAGDGGPGSNSSLDFTTGAPGRAAAIEPLLP